ncbi:hypothetical protein EAG_12104, partial [Camponotus floridanus]
VIDIHKKKKYVKWNHKKMDLELFREVLEWKCVGIPTISTAREAAYWMADALVDACNVSMPRDKEIKRHQACWWNNTIAELRIACRKARRRWQRCKRRRQKPAQEQLLEAEAAYRDARVTLRNEIKRAKDQAWSELIQSINNDPWGLPY